MIFYIILFNLGSEFNGIYAMSTKFPTLITAVTSIFYLAWQESAIKEYDSTNRDSFFTNVFRKYHCLLLSVCMCCIPSIKVIIKMFLLSVLQIILFYCVNVIIALSFGIGIDFQSAFHIIAGAACVQMSSTFIPSPGAAGGAELSYYVIYGSVFEAGQLSAAVLLWRIYTFYMPIVVGLFFSKDLFGKKFDKSFSFK